ncbi:hypothetical protein, partial [Maribacter sp.]
MLTALEDTYFTVLGIDKRPLFPVKGFWGRIPLSVLFYTLSELGSVNDYFVWLGERNPDKIGSASFIYIKQTVMKTIATLI